MYNTTQKVEIFYLNIYCEMKLLTNVLLNYKSKVNNYWFPSKHGCLVNT